MDTTGTISIALSLLKHKMITCLHKYYTYSEIPCHNILNKEYYAVSTGISKKDLDNLDEIMTRVDPKFICIDVANGYSSKFLEICKQVRKNIRKK